MKVEQFTDHSRVEIWFPSRLLENLTQPDQWKFYWNFDINSRWKNLKQFQISYVGNKYLSYQYYLPCLWESWQFATGLNFWMQKGVQMWLKKEKNVNRLWPAIGGFADHV